MYDLNIPAMPIPLAHINRAADTQLRAQLNPDALAEMKRAYAEGDRIDERHPVDLFFDGADYHPGDGWHRIEACTDAGHDSINARVHKGSERDARIFAAWANKHHGVRRNAADRRLAIEALLADDEWSRKSDRLIADHCGVDHKTVGQVRKERAESTGECSPVETEGKDGKVRKRPQPRARQEATTASEPQIEGFEANGAATATATKTRQRGARGGEEKVTAAERKEARKAFGMVTRFFDRTKASLSAEGRQAAEVALESFAEEMRAVWG